MPTSFYIVTDEDLARLDRVRLRLYREERLDGDAQRDLAHALTATRDAALAIPHDPPAPGDVKADILDGPRALLAELDGFIGVFQRTMTLPEYAAAATVAVEIGAQAIRSGPKASHAIAALATALSAALHVLVERIEQDDPRDLRAKLVLGQAMTRANKRAAGEPVDE